MARPGPRPTPTPLKIPRGNPGKRRLNAAEPRATAAVLRCPAWLDDAARKKWKQLAPQLAKLGLLTSIDGDALAGYCIAWSQLRAASALIAKEGLTVETATGGL